MDKSEILQQLYTELEELREKTGVSKRQLSLEIGKSENWYQQSLKKMIDIPYSDVMLLRQYLTK